MAIHPPPTPRPVASLPDTATTTRKRPVPADPAHATPPDAVTASLHVDPERGLTQAEAARRLAGNGPNELAPPPRPSIVGMLWQTVAEPFILVLVAAGALAVILGETRDGLLILAGLVPIVGGRRRPPGIGPSAPWRPCGPRPHRQRAFAATVMPLEFHARESVVGDILLLSTRRRGRRRRQGSSPARSALVDRSRPYRRVIAGAAVARADRVEAPLTERRSMVYAGTSIVGGTAEAVVVATGADTEVGRISRCPRAGTTASLASAG